MGISKSIIVNCDGKIRPHTVGDLRGELTECEELLGDHTLDTVRTQLKGSGWRAVKGGFHLCNYCKQFYYSSGEPIVFEDK